MTVAQGAKREITREQLLVLAKRHRERIAALERDNEELKRRAGCASGSRGCGTAN